MEAHAVLREETFERFSDLLRCPACNAAGSLRPRSVAVDCVACGGQFRSVDDIIDFVSGASNTALDVEAYDVEKGVTHQGSRDSLRLLKSVTGCVGWNNLGDVLEIGAGTGMITMSLLEHSFRRAVITDISPQMLTLCRQRVRDSVPQAFEKTLFATYDSQIKLFADRSFDVCIANSVLHHVRDYRSLLKDVARALRPGGLALCVEPTEKYHDALSRAMSDAVCELMARRMEDIAALQRMSAIIWDARARLAFYDQPMFAALEDKHLFTRTDLAEAAGQAGFRHHDIRPYFRDPNGSSGARDYVREAGIEGKSADLILEAYERYAAHHFRDIPPEDCTVMYTCIFHR